MECYWGSFKLFFFFFYEKILHPPKAQKTTKKHKKHQKHNTLQANSKNMLVPLNHTFEQKLVFLGPLEKLNCLNHLIYITTVTVLVSKFVFILSSITFCTKQALTFGWCSIRVHIAC